MTRLTDHRRFAAATASVVAVSAAALCVLLLAARRPHSAAGLAAGATVALIDVWLMVRALDRLQRYAAGLALRAVSASTFTRFILVGMLVGIVLCARGLDPFGVVAGFLLFPAAIAVVGVSTLRHAGPAPAPERLDGAAG